MDCRPLTEYCPHRNAARSKNALPHFVPLSSPVLAIVRRQQAERVELEEPCPWVFTSNGETPFPGWVAVETPTRPAARCQRLAYSRSSPDPGNGHVTRNCASHPMCSGLWSSRSRARPGSGRQASTTGPCTSTNGDEPCSAGCGSYCNRSQRHVTLQRGAASMGVPSRVDRADSLTRKPRAESTRFCADSPQPRV